MLPLLLLLTTPLLSAALNLPVIPVRPVVYSDGKVRAALSPRSPSTLLTRISSGAALPAARHLRCAADVPLRRRLHALRPCLDTFAALSLPSVPPWPCAAPPTFLLSCMLPNLPRFVAAGANAAGLGQCNKTEVALKLASETLCRDGGSALVHPPCHPIEEPDALQALFESGGQSVLRNPGEYREPQRGRIGG